MSKKELFGTFASPGAEWRGKPFWSWNGELREEELTRQVEVMKEMGLGGYFMHSRAGLITEYLGDEWFDLINAVADAGEKMGMALPIWGLFMKKVLQDGTLGVYETDRFIAPPGISLDLNCDGSDADAVVKAEDEEEFFFE